MSDCWSNKNMKSSIVYQIQFLLLIVIGILKGLWKWNVYNQINFILNS